MPVIRLTNGNDAYTITDPTEGPYVVFGRRGNDTITGNTSDDVLFGNQGDDTLTGGGGNDILDGGDGNDVIHAAGAPGSTDRLTGFVLAHGGNGDDRLDAGNPLQQTSGALLGEDGNDVIDAHVLHGAWTIYGGTGNDTVRTGLTSSSTMFFVDGGDGNDAIGGTGGTNTFLGGAGDDALSGAFGSFDLSGGDGNDSLSLGSFASGTLDGGNGDDALTGNAQRDSFVMHGGEGNDRLGAVGNASSIREQYFGDGGDDVVVAIGGDDFLNGGDGNDTLAGGGGADSINGGAGIDGASYANARAGVTANLRAPNFNTGDATGDTYISIEGLIGSSFNDTLTIDNASGAWFVMGGGGDDAIDTGRTASTAIFDVDGGSGNDTISGVGGTNRLSGGAGDDTITSAFGTFDLFGGDGNDSLSLGSFSRGTLDGGNGDDTLTGNAQRDDFVMHGGNGNDRLEGVGNFSSHREQYFGDAGDDTIIAIGGSDFLHGGDGNDALAGGGGSDFLYGGRGADRMDGGSDFDYASYSSSGAALVADLKTPSNNTGDAAGDTYLSIEGLIGSRFNDIVTGDDGINDVAGWDGDDVVNGWAGNDNIQGMNGNDMLDGGIGMDRLVGGAGDDIFLFNRGEGHGDGVADFAGNGAAAGDRFLFRGYGLASEGATFVQVDATHWSINSSDGAVHEVIRLVNGAAVHATDYTFEV